MSPHSEYYSRNHNGLSKFILASGIGSHFHISDCFHQLSDKTEICLVTAHTYLISVLLTGPRNTPAISFPLNLSTALSGARFP